MSTTTAAAATAAQRQQYDGTDSSNNNSSSADSRTTMNSSGVVGGHKDCSCHFEDGNGHFEVINGNLSWHWITNASVVVSTKECGDKNCTVSNHLDALVHGQYHLSKPLHIITLGDSLDRNIITRWICGPIGRAEQDGFQLIGPRQRSDPQHPEWGDHLINRGKLGKISSSLCTNYNISFGFLKIFGMHHDCDDAGYMYQEDDRKFNTTAERVEKLLDFEILSRLPNHNISNVVIMVSSNLWDLSRGNGCNNRVGVTEEYQQLYRTGILNLYATIRRRLPGAPVFWKTSPAIGLEYSNKIERQGLGRTRANQETLNTIMRKTVAEHNLGVVVDWWALSNRRTEDDRGFWYDERHYGMNASLVFYNMFFSALLEYHPDFLHQ